MTSVLVLGGAKDVLQEAEAAMCVMEFDAVLAAKRVVEVYAGPLWAFATLHPDNAADSLRKRARAGYSDPQFVFANRSPANCQLTNLRVTTDWGGSSGLFAVKCAVEAGFTRIVLAGVPLTPGPHFDKNDSWTYALNYRNNWRKHKEKYAHLTRSMSGWTREVLGEPTAQWALSGS